MELDRQGDSFDTSQTNHFVTAKGLIEISGSPALVSTTGLLHFSNLVIVKPLVYGECHGLSLFNDDHPPSKTSTFHLEGSTLPFGCLPVRSLSPGGNGTPPRPPGQGHYRLDRLKISHLKTQTIHVCNTHQTEGPSIYLYIDCYYNTQHTLLLCRPRPAQ